MWAGNETRTGPNTGGSEGLEGGYVVLRNELQNSRMTHVWHKRSVLLSQYSKFTICCQCYKVVAPAERSKVMVSYRHIQNHLLDDFHMSKL